MREILFRGKTLEGKWIKGSYVPKWYDGVRISPVIIVDISEVATGLLVRITVGFGVGVEVLVGLGVGVGFGVGVAVGAGLLLLLGGSIAYGELSSDRRGKGLFEK